MLKKLINDATGLFTLSIFIFFSGPLLAIIFIYILINCSTEPEIKNNKIEKFITEKLIISPKKIDMRPFLSESWSELCFLGPYTKNDTTQKILGFKWDSDTLTDVGINDGRTILVFIKNNQVLYFDSISRAQIDFSVFSSQCVNRKNAIFLKTGDSLHGEKWAIQGVSKP